MSAIDEAVRRQLTCGGSLDARRVVALFVAGMRWHLVRPGDFVEQPYGLVASCERCRMVVKIPREQARPEAAEGEVVEQDCPARP